MRQYSFSISTEEKLISSLQKLAKEKSVREASELLITLSIGNCDQLIATTCIEIIKSVFPQAKIAGLSTAGEITNGELSGYTVSVSVLAFQKSHVKLIVCDLETQDPYDASSHVSYVINSTPYLKHVHMMATSVSIGHNLSKFFRTISLNSPSIRVTGISAADIGAPTGNSTDNVFVFSEKIMHVGAIFILLIGENLEVRSSMNLGWIPVGKDHIVTEVKNELTVSKIDDEPAADFYRKYLGISISQNLVKNSVEFPVIVKRNSNNYIARNIMAAFPDGSLMYNYNINAGEHIHLSFGSPETILRDAEEDSSEIAEFNPEALILSICTIRNMYMGQDEKTEINCYKSVCPSTSGSLGFGEIYRCGFVVEQLTYALVSLALRENIPPEERIIEPDDSVFQKEDITTDIEESENDYGSIADAYAFEATDEIDLEACSNSASKTVSGKNKAKDYSSGLVLVPTPVSKYKKKRRKLPYSIKTTSETIPLTDRMFSLLKETTSEYVSIKEQEKELNLINKLEIEKKANEAKSSFLSHMSHELRTPINAILGMDEMIIRESNNSNILQYASDIKEAGEDLVSVVNDVLDYSNIESGKLQLSLAPYYLSSMLNDLIIMTRTQTGKKGLKLKVSIDKNIPDHLVGDMLHIKQCLSNLLSNAVKYTSSGQIRFIVSMDETSTDDTAKIIFHVRDTGNGIKKDDMELLFKPFERIEESKNRNINGTGLGLNITDKLLVLMKSSLNVESVYQKGSDFYFTLEQEILDPSPIGNFDARIKEISEHKSTVVKDVYAPEAVVLVVDDNKMNLTVVKKLLARTHINVDTAQCGCDAIEMASSKKYDIIFMDHLMPEMDGIETLRHIKGNDYNININTPTVILTANTVSGMKDEFLSAGFDDYLEKPTKPELLDAIVKKYIPDNKLISSENHDDEPSDSTGTKYLRATLLETINTVCDEIDINSGIESCGSVETYINILEQYLQNGDETLFLIEHDLKKSDYNDYRIRVHSLKSTSSLIGAMELSKEAFKLEESVTNGNTNIIIQETPIFLNNFKKLLRKLSAAFDSADASEKRDEEKEPITKEQFEAAISTIKEFISVFDFDSADYVIKELSKCKVPIEDEDFFKTLKIMVKNVDHDDLMPILERRIP